MLEAEAGFFLKKNPRIYLYLEFIEKGKRETKEQKKPKKEKEEENKGKGASCCGDKQKKRRQTRRTKVDCSKERMKEYFFERVGVEMFAVKQLQAEKNARNGKKKL